METALEFLGFFLMFIGVLGSVVPILPGVSISLIGAFLIAWSRDFSLIAWPTLIVVGSLAVLGVVVDFLASMLGVKRLGASRLALAGALIGAILGVFAGMAGMVLGPLAGALIGELASGAKLKQAWNVGVAAFVAMLLGGAIKVALAIAMLVIVAFAYFI